MRSLSALLALVSGVVASNCHPAMRPSGASSQAAAVTTSASTVRDSDVFRAVFRDSAIHAQYCEPLLPGTDWRRVCTPKDQSPVLRKPPMP
jgi:hypothetical protein